MTKKTNLTKETNLIKACKIGYLEQAKALVAQGADIHTEDDTDIQWAAIATLN